MSAAALPYWRLAGFYFFFFAVMGVLAPFWGAYLRSVGFRAVDIGGLIAVLHGTRLVAPYVWGWVVDHTGRRMGAVRVAAAAATVLFAGVLVRHDFWWMACLSAGFGFFWNGALPQFEANTMNHLTGRDHEYSRIRLWGSVGFIGAVTLAGLLTDQFGHAMVPWAVLGLFAGLWVCSVLAPQARQPRMTGQPSPFLRVLKRPDVAGFFGACFLLQASHGPFYAFYSIYLGEHGYSGAAIGVLWASGVVAEIVVFTRMHRWLPRFGPRRLLLASLLLAVVRWFLVALFPDQWWMQAGAQLLHAATFGVYHAVGISLINRFFVGANQGRGQALYSSLTFGAGVAVGSLAGGYVWSLWGGSAVYLMAAGFAAAGVPVALRSVRPRTNAVSGATHAPL